MNDCEEKEILLNKIKQLSNEFVLKNNNIVFNPSVFRNFDKKVCEQLSTLLNYKDLDRVIFKYLEEKRRYKMIEFYDETNVFEKKRYESACEQLEKVLTEADDDMIDILNKWFLIYENQQDYNNFLDSKDEIDKQVQYDDWVIPDEECEKDEQKTRRY